jgi:succinate-semialdehyde dehydrogenase/glutarate-semialdehyde dehydrogenase
MQNYIDGEWTGKDSEKIEVTNPATGEVVGTVPKGSKDDAEKAVSSASKALSDWGKKPAGERAELLMKLNDLMLENVDELADLMTLENGKPRKESVGEVKYAASFIQWFAEEGKRVYGRIVPGKSETHRIQVIKQPVGVVAAITPWNFPAAMITRKLAPA